MSPDCRLGLPFRELRASTKAPGLSREFGLLHQVYGVVSGAFYFFLGDSRHGGLDNTF